MKPKQFLSTCLAIASLILSACAPQTTAPTAAIGPAIAINSATSAPVPAIDESIASFDGAVLSVPAQDCNSSYTGLIQSVVATDANRVTFILCRAEPDFLFKIAWPTNAIYPSEWIESTAQAGARSSEGLEHPVGSGPYIVGEWQRGASLAFVPNPSYWGAPAATPTLLFVWSSSASDRLYALQAGIVDGIDNLSQNDFETVRADSTLALAERPLLAESFIERQSAIPLLDNILGGLSALAYRADVTHPQASPIGIELFHLSAPGERESFIWMQAAEPTSLFCADESDLDSLRACAQVTETLYKFDFDGGDPIPALAESCAANYDRTVWTCTLRTDVQFHDGTLLEASDVVATFNMGLNIDSPFHVGGANDWKFYDALWGLMKKPGG